MIDTFRLLRLDPGAPSRTWQELRAMSAEMAHAQPPPTGVEVSPTELGGVRVEQTRPGSVEVDRHIVYVHGGGYICGSAGGQRAFLGALAHAVRAEVHAVEYRLAPEHRCPAAIDDVVAAIAAVQALSGDRPVVVGGDSAGGGLAVASVVEIRERGLELPQAMFALSPWADMTLSGPCLDEFAECDVMVRRNDLTMMRGCYLGDDDPAGRHPSPALTDLTGLPPLLVQVGGDEILLGDARLLVERARAAGVRAELEIADGMFHTWQVLAPELPESQGAIASIAGFLSSV